MKKSSLKKLIDEERTKYEKLGYHLIILSDILTLKKNNLLKNKHASPIWVSSKMYKELRKAPKKITNFVDYMSSNPLNAYIFGKSVPSTHYQFYEGHIGSRTGLLDITEWQKNPTDFNGTTEIKKWWNKIYKPYKWKLDNREALKKVRMVHPSILFLGDVDKRATLYYHRNTKDEIDSIAIVF